MKSSFDSTLSASLTFSGFTPTLLTSIPVDKYLRIPYLSKRGILLSFLLVALTGVQAQTRHYVNLSATGSNNGQTWQNAFTDLQPAISIAQTGDSIWIAQGTYYPTSTTDRTISFEPRSGVRIFGGFSGTETEVSQRDWDANQTILSGDIGTIGDSTDNTNNIMAFGEVEEGTLLDGLTFRGGVSEGTFVYDIFQRDGCGGGIYVNAEDGVGYLVVRNCRFERNYAQLKGAAVFVRASQDGSIAPQFLNCVFEYNSGSDGAAVYCNGYVDIERVPDFGNCTFLDNKILVNPQSVIRYINPSKDDTLHFSDCRFEKHSGQIQWRMIWTNSGNHIRIDQCIFNENRITIIRPEIFGTNVVESRTIYITNSEFTNSFGMLGFFINGEARVLNCVFRNNRGSLSPMASKTKINNCLLDSNTFGVSAINIDMNCVDCSISNLTVINSKGNGASLFRIVTWSDFVHYSNINMINNDSLGLFTSSSLVLLGVFTNFNVIGNKFFQLPNVSTVPGHFQNSIFFGNKFITPDYYSGFPSLTFENCSIDYPDASYFPSNVTCINSLFNRDPLFRDTANGDYSLLPCSPLLNAGSNLAAAGILTDIAGNPRILEGTVDIGAYEAPAFTLAAAPAVSPACVGTEGGSISIQPVNGCEPYTYNWMPNAGTGPELNELPSGAYQLTLTDASGREITETVLVPEAPQPALSLATTHVQCGNPAGGSLAAQVSSGTGPFAYTWLPLAEDTSMLNNLAAGDYALTIVDANGCQDSATAAIALLGQITLTIGGQIIPCHGETGWLSATPSTGAAPFTWHWDGWPGTDPVAEPLGPGQYSVTVTDAYGCTAANTYPPMTEPGPLSVGTGSSDQTQSNPPNGAAVVTTISGGTGPFGYLWEPGGGTTQSIAGLVAGTYTVTVTDKNGCSISTEVIVHLMLSSTAATPEAGVIIYPNPAVDWLRVLLPAAQSSSSWHLELSDASGRVVRSQGCASGDCVLDLSGLASGAYVLTAWNGQERWTGRVLKH